MNKWTNLLFIPAVLLASCAGEKRKITVPYRLQPSTIWISTARNTRRCIMHLPKASGPPNTRIVEGDTTASAAAARADETYAAFTGSSANIDSCRKYLAMKDKLLPLQVRQLEAMLFMAGNNPASAGEVVKERIDATNHQTELLYGCHYMLHGKEVSTNDIDNLLRDEKNISRRLDARNASKEVGTTLKDGLAELQRLRNASVTPLGYDDFCLPGV